MMEKVQTLLVWGDLYCFSTSLWCALPTRSPSTVDTASLYELIRQDGGSIAIYDDLLLKFDRPTRCLDEAAALRHSPVLDVEQSC